MPTPVPSVTPWRGPQYALAPQGCQGESAADEAQGHDGHVVPAMRLAC